MRTHRAPTVAHNVRSAPDAGRQDLARLAAIAAPMVTAASLMGAALGWRLLGPVSGATLAGVALGAVILTALLALAWARPRLRPLSRTPWVVPAAVTLLASFAHAFLVIARAEGAL